ncbi:MAG: EthD domain-containing protein [Reyranella sp.]|uniref:EthD domain-containing protein n=1 Tax=Reyranella sp. TaxID=1929291 RepID=UPI003D1169F8
MLKLTFCLRRLPALTAAEFHDYWLHKHGPLVRRLQPALGMVRYVQVHRLDEALEAPLGDGMRKARGAPEPYDGIAELWWESEESYRAARRTPEAREAGRLLLEDEAKFIDLARSPLWLNREHVIHPAAERRVADAD